VDGLLAALDRVDQVIEIVRKAPDQAAARVQLQQDLGTSEDQTDAILRLQLGQLTRLNKGKLTEEKSELEQSRVRVSCEQRISWVCEVTS
jgi:DNA gyrase subunit A